MTLSDARLRATPRQQDFGLRSRRELHGPSTGQRLLVRMGGYHCVRTAA
jgi:hypothetical protein